MMTSNFRSKLGAISFPIFSILVLAAGLWSYWQTGQLKNLSFKADTIKTITLGDIHNSTDSAVLSVTDSLVSTQAIRLGLITTKGDELLVLVDKNISLPADYYPKDLVSLDGQVPDYAGAQLRAEAAAHLVEMFKAARENGLDLTVTSAYRSYQTQIVTFNHWVAVSGLAAAEQISARAGHSQHQLGTAVDLSASNVGNNLSSDFGSTAAGKWLAANSYRYGFILSYPAGKEAVTGYAYEPWHIRYIGAPAATQLHGLGWDLETYLRKYGVW